MAHKIGIIMGSRSDWDTMRHASEMLESLGIEHDVRVVSAHRTPDRMVDYAKAAAGRGLKVIIAGAGGAAHLAGVLAAHTTLPVIGVPIDSGPLSGFDALLSTAQMPGGIPVATVAVGKAGAKNAGYLAGQMLAIADPALAERIAADREANRQKIRAANDALQSQL